MNDSIDILKELSLLIRNATKSGENTAERVGRTFVGIVDILSEITLDRLREIFLRKDQSDGTNFLLKFGEFIDSMIAGKGTGIFPNGRIQTDRLEVRGSMTVMDLIINEIHAMAGEFNFSDCGKIEKVEFVSESTYKLWMEKETETDITNLDEHDILYSIVNN